MIHAELVATSTLDKKFHTYSEQITGINTASVVQKGTRPRSEHAYILAYYKAFSDPQSDISQLRELLGMTHFTMLCAGTDIEMGEVTGSQHGLRCLSSPVTRRGIIGVLFSGDGEQWSSALRNAGSGILGVQEWGRTCHQQFTKNNLDYLIGRLKPNGETQYLLT